MDGVVSSSNQVTNNERHDREDTEGDSDASTPDKSQTNLNTESKVASARMGLGVTTLKRVCCANNMSRWPFRKRKSLGNLIDRTKQVLDDGTGQNNMQKLAALQVLEKQRQVMRNCQHQDMDDEIKKYRQAMFKLDHQGRSHKASANHLKTNLTAISTVQRILPCKHNVVTTTH